MATLTTLNAASPLNASDAARAEFVNATTPQVLSYALDNVDTNFDTMDTLTFSIQYRLSEASVDDTFDLNIRIVNGATILAAANSGGTFQSVASNITTTTDTYNTATGFTYVNTTADKATWDGASVELQHNVGKSKGWDGVVIEANHAIFDGTYTLGAAPETHTGTGAIDTTVATTTGTGLAFTVITGTGAINSTVATTTGTGTVTPAASGAVVSSASVTPTQFGGYDIYTFGLADTGGTIVFSTGGDVEYLQVAGGGGGGMVLYTLHNCNLRI